MGWRPVEETERGRGVCALGRMRLGSELATPRGPRIRREGQVKREYTLRRECRADQAEMVRKKTTRYVHGVSKMGFKRSPMPTVKGRKSDREEVGAGKEYDPQERNQMEIRDTERPRTKP